MSSLGCGTDLSWRHVLPLTVLLKFRAKKGRDPSLQSYAKDAEMLLQLRGDVLGPLGVRADLLPDDFARWGKGWVVFHVRERKRLCPPVPSPWIRWPSAGPCCTTDYHWLLG